MPLRQIDINQIQLDQPQTGGLVPVDIGSIEMDKPGFFSRVNQDILKRGAQAGAAIGRTGFLGPNQQSVPETVFQLGGTGAGLITDVAGEGLRSGYHYLVPQNIQSGISEIGNIIGETGAPQAAAETVSPLMQRIDEMMKAHPRLAANLGATGNLATFYTPIPKTGTSLAGATVKTVGAANKAVPGSVKRFLKEESTLPRPSIKETIPSSEEVFGTARGAYKIANEVGGVLKPEVSTKFVNSVLEMTPQTELGKLFEGDSKFTQLVDKVKALDGKPITLQAAEEIDKYLSKQITYKPNGYMDADGEQVYKIQQKLRDHFLDPKETDIIGGKEGFDAYNTGVFEWGKAASLRDIENIAEVASRSDNPKSYIKSAANRLLKSKNIRFYAKEEIPLIKKMASTGIISNTLIPAASRLLPIVAGGAHGVPGFAAGTAANMAARAIQDTAQMRKLENVAVAVAKRKPKTRVKP